MLDLRNEEVRIQKDKTRYWSLVTGCQIKSENGNYKSYQSRRQNSELRMQKCTALRRLQKAEVRIKKTDTGYWMLDRTKAELRRRNYHFMAVLNYER